MFRLSIDTIVGFSLACNILILIEVVSSGSAWLVKETLFQVLDEGTFKETKVVSASEPPLYIAKSTGSEFKISKEAFNWAPVIKSLNGKFTNDHCCPSKSNLKLEFPLIDCSWPNSTVTWNEEKTSTPVVLLR